MRKQVFGRRLKRDKNERKALFKGLMSSLVLHGRIKTTEEKAKAIKGQIEKLTTKAKKGKTVTDALRLYLTPESITKLITDVAPTFQNRPGGYTRIVRLGKRFSDKASMVLLEWVEDITVQSSKLKVESEEEKVTKTEDVEKTVEVEKPKKVARKTIKKAEPKTTRKSGEARSRSAREKSK